MSATPRVYLAKKSTILKIRLVTKTTCTNKTNEEEKLVLLPENEIEEISRENQTIHELVENLLDQVEIRTNLQNCQSLQSSLLCEASMRTNEQNSMAFDFDEIPTSHNPVCVSSPIENQPQNQTCSCQCRKDPNEELIRMFNDEFSLFGEKLNEIRERRINGARENLLLKTMKQQHEELVEFFQKVSKVEKIDQQSQTTQNERVDSQSQTDFQLKPNSVETKPKSPDPVSPKKSEHELVDLTLEDEENRENLPKTNFVACSIEPPSNGQKATDFSIDQPVVSVIYEHGQVQLTWILPSSSHENIESFEIFATKKNPTESNVEWKMIGTVKFSRTIMRVTLEEFQSNSFYGFSVRAVSKKNTRGPFSKVKSLYTGNHSVQPLQNSQLFNQFSI